MADAKRRACTGGLASCDVLVDPASVAMPSRSSDPKWRWHLGKGEFVVRYLGRNRRELSRKNWPDLGPTFSRFRQQLRDVDGCFHDLGQTIVMRIMPYRAKSGLSSGHIWLNSGDVNRIWPDVGRIWRPRFCFWVISVESGPLHSELWPNLHDFGRARHLDPLV